MRMNVLKGAILVALVGLMSSFDLPKEWFAAGNMPQSYRMGIDPSVKMDGRPAATIQSIEPKIDGFGTLMQNCAPDKYLGKRVRMTGYIKSSDVSGWAGLWFRVDGKESSRSLAFDNMQKRAVKGTTPWTKYEIVLDVPQDAAGLAYGALLAGTGKIWFADVSFEIVDPSVPVTDMVQKASLLAEPANLDFSK